MSITETPVETPPERKKRKYTRRKKKADKPQKVSELAGITAADCPAACNADGCVISGKPYCAHPYKGGLQGNDLHNSEASGRLESAKKMLGKKKIKLGSHAYRLGALI